MEDIVEKQRKIKPEEILRWKQQKKKKMEIAKLINNKPNHKVGDEDEGNEGK